MTGKWVTADTTIALQNMVIGAWVLGIGSCWIGAFDEDKIKEQLKIPKDWKAVALVTWNTLLKNLKPKRKNQSKNYSA